jgi:hypothetical protein
MGVESFVFIADEYERPFAFEFTESTQYKILCVNGISNEHSLSIRQIENYNHYLHKIKTEYVCVIDVDEFLHPKTIEFLGRHRPQSIELPWRIMCLNVPEQRTIEGSLFSGILVPQRKSISKVKDIAQIKIHNCIFGCKGKNIGYGRCTHLPINHFYIRDAQDIELFESASFEKGKCDSHFSGRILTMYLMHAMCIRFHEYQEVFELSDFEQDQLLVEQPNSVKKMVNGDSIVYLYFFAKFVLWISALIGIGFGVRIRDFPKALNKFEKSESHLAKSWILIVWISRYFYSKFVKLKLELKSAMEMG